MILTRGGPNDLVICLWVGGALGAQHEHACRRVEAQRRAERRRVVIGHQGH